MDKKSRILKEKAMKKCGIDFFSDVSACYGTGTEGVSDWTGIGYQCGWRTYSFRDLKTEKPLNGDHRIIDGLSLCVYIQAEFGTVFTTASMESMEYNKLKCDGTYKDGKKDGVFKMYDSEGRAGREVL